MPEKLQPGGSYAQTLGRGVRVLEVLAVAQVPLTLAQIADRLHVNRSVAYRLVRTLIAHRLIEVATDDRYALGLGLITLARGVDTDLRRIAHPILVALSEDLKVTAVLNAVDGDEVVCLLSAEPKSSGLRVAYREGLRYPLDQGASGIAILSARSPKPHERGSVTRAREVGYAMSDGELEADTTAISVPIRRLDGGCRSTITLLSATSQRPDEERAAKELAAAARTIADALEAGHAFP
jgi:DNA-binding IclR family transcriptional regulator